MSGKNKKLRVFLGLAEIAGNFSRLKTGLTRLGHEVLFYAPREHLFDYPGVDAEPPELTQLIQSERLRILKVLEFESSISCGSPSTSRWRWQIQQWKKRYKLWCMLLSNIGAFIKFVLNFDAFVFHYGNSFHLKAQLVYFDDLFWLRLLRRRVVFLYCGSDSRPAFLDGAIAHNVAGYDAEVLANISQDNQRNNLLVEKRANFVISNVFSSYFFQQPTVSLQAIGNAAFLPTVMKIPSRRSNPIIVHAPSRSDAKGTSEIIRCIEELRSEGLELTLKILQGEKNSVVMAALDDCDFVIDQIYSDSPLATFASEAAAYGKPAIVGSYISKQAYEAAFHVHGVPPSELCHPDQLKESIRHLVLDIDYRLALGAAARSYVQKILAPEAVAQRYLALFSCQVPKKWMFSPRSISITPPVGMTEELAARLSRESNAHHTGDYFLPTKPKMQASLRALSNTSEH